MRDTVDALLSELADPAWEEIEALWEEGKISSRECMARQVALIRGGWPAIKAELDRMTISPGLKEFVSWCQTKNISFSIVSDGLDRVIQYLLERHEIKVDRIYANHLIEAADGSLSLQSSNGPRLMQCQSGVCKCMIANGVSSVVKKVIIGDGRSDFCWAKEADILFAKSKLIDFCQKENLVHNSFSDFHDIRAALEAFTSGQPNSVVFNIPMTVTVVPTASPAANQAAVSNAAFNAR